MIRHDTVYFLWHGAHVHPNNIILGVEGDFDSSAMEAKLQSAFGSWPKGPAAVPANVSFKEPNAGVYFVEKSDVNQSNIRMVELGTREDNPDYYAIEVMNEIFGGSFSSRLMQNIRTKKGLAYSVGGGVGTAFDHPGLFQVSMGTKSGTTAAAIDALFEEVEGIKTHPATTEEMKKGKDAILNSFIFRFDSKAKVLAERMSYEFYGYPADFLERYQAGIEKVTQADVARVAAEYVHKDRLAVLVVGKASDFDKPLTSFGPVTTLDITIPEPGAGNSAAAASASNPEGRALLAKVIEGLGGEARIKRIKAVRVKANVTVKTPQGELPIEAESIAVLPDRTWQKLGTPMGEMVMVVTPQAAFMAAPQGSQDMPPSRKEEALKDMMREPMLVAQHSDDPSYTFSAGKTEKIGELESRVLDVNTGVAQVRWFVDPQTGHIVRASWQGEGMGGPGETVADYADWKPVEGITLPFKETRTQNGERAMSIEVKEVSMNPTVDPKIFEKPAASSGGPQSK